MAAGKCPFCAQSVTSLRYHRVEAKNVAARAVHSGVTLHCPHCFVVLGAQLDPIAIAQDLLSGVEKAVAKAAKR